MSALLLDGNKVAKVHISALKTILEILQKEHKLEPKLAVILVGDDAASKIYVQHKINTCHDTGISYQSHSLSNDIKESSLLELIHSLNEDPSIHGILVQLPLPKHINSNTITSAISPTKDVDGLHPLALGHLVQGTKGFVPCTPLGIMNLLAFYGLADVKGQNITIVGASTIVGKPLSILLTHQDATVTLTHIHTKAIKDHLKNADIVISAIGKPDIYQNDWFKKDVILIDVGIRQLDNGKVSGDFDFKMLQKIASYITPVPGGVGPMTVTSLMENTVNAAINIANIKI